LKDFQYGVLSEAYRGTVSGATSGAPSYIQKTGKYFNLAAFEDDVAQSGLPDVIQK
jgi:hypothetical protein